MRGEGRGERGEGRGERGEGRGERGEGRGERGEGRGERGEGRGERGDSGTSELSDNCSGGTSINGASLEIYINNKEIKLDR